MIDDLSLAYDLGIPPARPSLLGIVGSRAYGLDTPESDTDWLGVFVAPLRHVLSIRWNAHKETLVRHNPHDLCLHEVGKFCRLALAANPTILELLWLPEYETQDMVGRKLVGRRSAFLSNRVRKTYGGYARQQVERLIARGDGSFGSDLRKRREKHARHCFRLLIQGTDLLRYGEIRLRLDAREIQLVTAVSKLSDEKLLGAFAEYDDVLQNTLSVLRDEPETDKVDDMLYSIRTHWSPL